MIDKEHRERRSLVSSARASVQGFGPALPTSSAGPSPFSAQFPSKRYPFPVLRVAQVPYALCRVIRSLSRPTIVMAVLVLNTQTRQDLGAGLVMKVERIGWFSDTGEPSVAQHHGVFSSH